MKTQTLTLEQQRDIMKQRRFIAMPLAGTLVWAAIGFASPFQRGNTNLDALPWHGRYFLYWFRTFLPYWRTFLF